MFFKKTLLRVTTIEKNNNDLIKKITDLEKKVNDINLTNNTDYIKDLENKLATISKANTDMYHKYSVLIETLQLQVKKNNQNIDKISVENTDNNIKIKEDLDMLVNKLNNLDTETQEVKDDNLQIKELINNLENTESNMEEQITALKGKGWSLFG